MKTKFTKIATLIFSAVLVLALGLFAASCGDEGGGGGGGTDKTIAYEAGSLASATVGEAYTGTVATATGADGIKYSVTSGALPAGLTLAESGAISGTPTQEIEGAEFEVTATANGATSAKATWTISVLAAGAKTYTFEAEYVDLEGVIGAGISNGAKELELIRSNKDASNGYFLTDMHRTGCSISFVINADDDVEATVSLVMSTSIGTLDVENGDFEMRVNGTKISYKTFRLKVGENNAKIFAENTLSRKINLTKGENVITFTVKENENLNGGSGAPDFDCMKISSTVPLSWEPFESNLE